MYLSWFSLKSLEGAFKIVMSISLRLYTRHQQQLILNLEFFL